MWAGLPQPREGMELRGARRAAAVAARCRHRPATPVPTAIGGRKDAEGGAVRRHMTDPSLATAGVRAPRDAACGAGATKRKATRILPLTQ